MTELTLPFLGERRAGWQYPFAEPGAGEQEAFLPQERIGLGDAIAAFTIASAYVNHAEASAGSTEPGKQADLVVLDRDLFAHPVAEIGAAKVDLTFVEGRLVYDRNG